MKRHAIVQFGIKLNDHYIFEGFFVEIAMMLFCLFFEWLRELKIRVVKG